MRILRIILCFWAFEGNCSQMMVVVDEDEPQAASPLRTPVYQALLNNSSLSVGEKIRKSREFFRKKKNTSFLETKQISFLDALAMESTLTLGDKMLISKAYKSHEDRALPNRARILQSIFQDANATLDQRKRALSNLMDIGFYDVAVFLSRSLPEGACDTLFAAKSPFSFAQEGQEMKTQSEKNESDWDMITQTSDWDEVHDWGQFSKIDDK